LRDGADPTYFCWARGLHLGVTVELVLWSRLNTGDYFLRGGSGKHRLRYRQHAELGGEWRDQYRHHARNVHVHISEWFNEREPNGDDHLHVDGYQCSRLNYVYAYRYSNGGRQTDHQLVHSEPHKYHFGLQQRTELDDGRRDQYRHHAGNVHVHISEWFNEREPNGDDHLHVDGYQCSRLNYVYAYRYSNDGRQTDHQLVHSEPHKYHFGLQQHTELGDGRRDQYRHHARNVHVHISEWCNEREPNGDDHLHVDSYQCSRLSYVDGTGHSDGLWRSIDDHHYVVPRRNTRRGIYRLYHNRQRRHSALYVFTKHG
jgi:hypothetical protein